MTIICAQCRVEGRKGVVGEKCPQCGERAEESWRDPGWYFCLNMDCAVREFDRGAGGVTHGLCTPCLERFGAELEFVRQGRLSLQSPR